MFTTIQEKLSVAVIAIALSTPIFAADIKHVFIAADESRGQLLYVDEFNPENDWTIPMQGNRDLQLLSDERFLASVPGGYREYEVKTGEMIKEVIVWKVRKDKRGRGDNCWSMVRVDNGYTYLGSKQVIYELDGNDKVVRQIKPSGGGCFRLLRMSKAGNFLFTSGITKVREIDSGGGLVKEFDLSEVAPDAKSPYFAARLGNGNTMISTGYGAKLIEVDKDWEVVRIVGGKGNIEGLEETHFFAQLDIRPNGNFVIAHWTGHAPDDSEKGPQAIELDADGKLVWQWHDAKRAGTFHGIVVIK